MGSLLDSAADLGVRDGRASRRRRLQLEGPRGIALACLAGAALYSGGLALGLYVIRAVLVGP